MSTHTYRRIKVRTVFWITPLPLPRWLDGDHVTGWRFTLWAWMGAKGLRRHRYAGRATQ